VPTALRICLSANLQGENVDMSNDVWRGRQALTALEVAPCPPESLFFTPVDVSLAGFSHQG